MLNPTDDRLPLSVSNWTTCIAEEAHIENRHTYHDGDHPAGQNEHEGRKVVRGIEEPSMMGIRKSASRSTTPDPVTRVINFGRDLVRLASFGFAVCILSGGLLGGAQAQKESEFVKACQVTESRKMCECMSSEVPAAMHGVAVAGMRRSNAMTQTGGPMLESGTLTQEEMQGLQEVVLAHASCMLVIQ